MRFMIFIMQHLPRLRRCRKLTNNVKFVLQKQNEFLVYLDIFSIFKSPLSPYSLKFHLSKYSGKRREEIVVETKILNVGPEGSEAGSSSPANVKPVIKASLIRSAIEHSLKQRAISTGSGSGGVKLTNDAIVLSRELIHAFVVEACNRSLGQYDLAASQGEVTEEHLFNVLPQLLLDF